MSPWIKFLFRFAMLHPSETGAVLGAAASVGKAISEDRTLGEYLAEATGVPVDVLPKLLADFQAIHK